MAKRKTVTIVYTNYAGRQFSKSFTGTQAEIDAEVERMRGLPDVADAWASL